MKFSHLEKESKAKAAKVVANMLHTPDKLEKIDQMIFNVERKKASVEAKLKTAMQSQLDGIRTGLTQLDKARVDIQDVKQGMKEIEASLEELPYLAESLSDVRDETIKHSQLATARENLKHIFNVPETVKQTENWIMDGKLLDAHKSLVELENSRDDLKYELHRLPHQSVSDRELLNDYFQPVTHLSQMMEKQIKYILRRTLNTVRKDPKVIVTALRIIEREEKADADCLERQKSTGFIPSGRPKQWKEKCLDVLKTNVQERIEGNQLDSREESKMWLVRHLELIRMITLEDLRIAKSLCQPVFPPHYDIYERFISVYHEALENRLREIIHLGLENQEYVTMLSWIIQTYPGKDLMGSSFLNIPKDKVKPLLDNETISRLEKEYLDNMKSNYTEWMQRTLSQEMEDWKKEDPEVDSDGYYHTSAPIIIYQMIDENLQVAATISPELVNKVLVMSLDQVCNYGQSFKLAIINYKNLCFKDRTACCYTRYMIAIINNLERFEELANELKTRWWKPEFTKDTVTKFETLLDTYSNLKKEALGYLLDESFLDIDSKFSDLLSSKWQNSTDAVDTVCATMDDYFEDYKCLKPDNFKSVTVLAQDQVARRYITSMLQNNVLRKKISFEGSDDRKKAADKIKSEAEQIKRLFVKINSDTSDDEDSPFEALIKLSEVLKTDKDMMALDIGTLIKHYPDVNEEQLVCLLTLRGDLSKSEARDKAQENVKGEDKSPFKTTTIFSQIQVTSSLNPFAN